MWKGQEMGNLNKEQSDTDNRSSQNLKKEIEHLARVPFPQNHVILPVWIAHLSKTELLKVCGEDLYAVLLMSHLPSCIFSFCF